MGVFCEFKVWPNFYLWSHCAENNLLLYGTAIYRDSTVFQIAVRYDVLIRKRFPYYWFFVREPTGTKSNIVCLFCFFVVRFTKLLNRPWNYSCESWVFEALSLRIGWIIDKSISFHTDITFSLIVLFKFSSRKKPNRFPFWRLAYASFFLT